MKVIKFIKENKVAMLALCVVLLSFVLLAIPGQFAHYGVNILSSKKASERFIYHLSGYQWIFATQKTVYNSDALGTASAQGIAAFALMILCVPGLLFSKKSSFVALLTSLALITVAVLFFSISAAGPKSYPNWHIQPSNNEYALILWVPYVIGALTIIAGALMAYKTFLTMKSEIKSPTQSKGPTYSYLKK